MTTLTDATPDQIANMLAAPIVKLYKRCARGKHDQCPGMFEAWSICSCDCHAGVSDMRAATTMPVEPSQMPVTCADKAEAVSEAIAIVSKPVKAKAKGARNIAGGLKVSTGHYKCYGHNSWADAEHPSGGEGTGHIDLSIFKPVIITPALQAQLDTIASWKGN